MAGKQFDAIVIGAVLARLHHAAGEIDGRKGAWALVKGGMGTITQVMAKSVLYKGGIVHTDAPVYSVLAEGGVVSGSHPGGGVTGAPGRNAAKRSLKDLPKFK